MVGKNSLTEAQVTQYREKGYVTGLPLFSEREVRELHWGLGELRTLLQPGENDFQINEWHETSRWLYDVCMEPRILDAVESLLGPDFFFWASHVFSKAPDSPDTVAWHQDAYYWDLHPHNTVTVWVAFTDVDEQNGAMQVIPGTHRAGLMQHSKAGSESVLEVQLENGTFRTEDAVSLNLKAGQFSIHDDALVHGSPANGSDRWRIGLTIRYSGIDVTCDLNKAPHFRMYMARGTDRTGHNPHGDVPYTPFARREAHQRRSLLAKVV